MPLHALREVRGLNAMRAVEHVSRRLLHATEVAQQLPFFHMAGALEVPRLELRRGAAVDDDRLLGDVVHEEVRRRQVAAGERAQIQRLSRRDRTVEYAQIELVLLDVDAVDARGGDGVSRRDRAV